MSRKGYLAGMVLILLIGGTQRALWLRSDPPNTALGIVWHDEGAWVHNARNRALWGHWRTDEWNPVFIAPVFTALEYGAFAVAGVGTWQARTVPAASGVAAVLLLMLGLSALAGRRVALLGGVLLATNYIFVMWNRAALMESTMSALIVAGWATYAMSSRRPVWGVAAGVAAVLAWFTKASAAFFAAALVADALLTIIGSLAPALRTRLGIEAPLADDRRGAWWTLAGLAVAALVVVLFFVVPHWTEYRFYNWQMTVTRKPAYGLRDLIDRASWLPIVQGFFSRMWLVVVGAALAIVGIVARWRTARPAERLLVLWMLVGLLELTIHDSGNERRYVMFIPALIALAALLAGSGAAWLPAGAAAARPASRALAAPIVLLLGYLVAGSLVRLPWLEQIQAGHFATPVRLTAFLALALTALLLLRWRSVTGWMARRRIGPRAALALVGIALAWNLGEYTGWAMTRGEINYRASVELGRLLPAGTLVQGKLANGLSLENQIRPVFIGRGFGNYADRFDRDDVRYILTYVLPSVGYESQEGSGLIQEILDRYPNRRIVRTFDVDETPAVEQAALIDKMPQRQDDPEPGPNRARH